MKSFLDIGRTNGYSFNSTEWREWEKVAKSLPELIKNGTIRKVVDELPIVDVDGFNEMEMKRAYTIFTFIAHSYVRGDTREEVIKILPDSISKVWIKSGDFLGVPPVATYAATVLFNFKYCQDLKKPENFEIEFTFTGTEDEKWFYAVSAAIDTQSEVIISCAERIFELEDVDFNEIGERITGAIEEMTRILNRMYEKCCPKVFYGQVRKYLTGWLNDPQLPDGLTYGQSNDSKIMKLAGGSAAQNPTIQLIDILLGVKHEPDSEDLMISGYNVGGCPRMNYLGAMRTYMPRGHCEYLNYIESRMIDTLIKFRQSASYDSCVRSLSNFRSEHIKMVTRYIICQSKVSAMVALGTGGSSPIQFLKKCRNETENCLNK